MGVCESLNGKYENNDLRYKVSNKKKNKGSNLFCAPIDSSPNNDNIYINNSMSQTMTMDISHYKEYQKPQIYKYVNKYKTTGLQKSIVKGSLVELDGQGNSLLNSNAKNSNINPNSLYSSKIDDTGYDSSYEGFEEMIIDGKMDEDLVQKSNDKNTINNYNEFIKKKDDNNGTKKNIVLDYYNKSSSGSNKKLEKMEENNEENKNGDDLSIIPSGSNEQNNSKGNIQKYILSMGKFQN